MNKYKIVNYNDFNRSDYLDRHLIIECLCLSNEVGISADYQDIKDQLFDNNDLIKLFIIDSNGRVKGYITGECFNGYNDNNILHIHNIVILPLLEKNGYAKELIVNLIEKYNPDIVTSETHNPKYFELFTIIPYLITYYPNLYRAIPTDIYNVTLNHPYLFDANRKLVCKGNYRDIQVQKYSSKKEVNTLFMDVDDYDALAVISILSDNKLDLRCKTMIKK